MLEKGHSDYAEKQDRYQYRHLGSRQKEVNKTGIVYRTNLNFRLAERYLDLLQKHGLVENRLDKYITTDKGKIFLAKAKEIALNLEEPARIP